MPDKSKLVTISVAAETLGVSIDTLRRWDNKGLLKTIRGDRNRRLFDLNEIRELNVKKNRVINRLSHKYEKKSPIHIPVPSGKLPAQSEWDMMNWIGNSVSSIRKEEIKFQNLRNKFKRYFLLVILIISFTFILSIMFFIISPIKSADYFGFKLVSNLQTDSTNKKYILGESTAIIRSGDYFSSIFQEIIKSASLIFSKISPR